MQDPKNALKRKDTGERVRRQEHQRKRIEENMFNGEPTIQEIAQQFVQANHMVSECDVYGWRGNHPHNRYAHGQVIRARNLAKKHRVTICKTCRGTGVEMTRDTPIALPCDWCDATGYNEKREERCWKCKGNRVTVYQKYHPHVCHNCGGARGFKEHDDEPQN